MGDGKVFGFEGNLRSSLEGTYFVLEKSLPESASVPPSQHTRRGHEPPGSLKAMRSLESQILPLSTRKGQ